MSNVDKVLNKILFSFLLFLFILKNTILINSSVFNIAFAVLILIFAGFYIITYKIYNLRTNNIIFLTLLGLILFQGFFLTYHHKFSFYKYFYDIVRYLAYIGIFIFGKYAFNNSTAKNLIRWFVIIILYHIITGYYALLTGDSQMVSNTLRLSGDLENVGQFGLLMGLSIIIFYIIFKYNKSYLYKTMIIALIILCLSLLAFNNTMRIIVALMFAFFMYFVVAKRKYYFLIIIIVLLVTMILINKDVYTRFAKVFASNYDVSEMGQNSFTSSFQWRVMQWYLLLKDWFNNYFFLGVGLGQQTFLHGFISVWGEPYVAHSDFVKLLVETGFIGFPVILFLSFWFYKFIRSLNVTADYQMIFMFFLFCLLTGNTLFTCPLQIYIFLLGYLSMI